VTSVSIPYVSLTRLPFLHVAQMALKINPNFEIANSNLAMAYTDLGTRIKGEGNIAEAIAVYRKALVHNSAYAEAWYDSKLCDTRNNLL
jgi:tetratricopeptide (TPR) repeat protein